MDDEYAGLTILVSLVFYVGLAYFPKQKSGQFIDQYFSTIGSPSLLLTSRYGYLFIYSIINLYEKDGTDWLYLFINIEIKYAIFVWITQLHYLMQFNYN